VLCAALDAPAPNRARKKASAQGAPAVVHDPKADWVPLQAAPFHYTSSGYIRPLEDWGRHLHGAAAKFFSGGYRYYDVGGYDVGGAFAAAASPEWSFTLRVRGKRWAAIRSMGMTTSIVADFHFTAGYLIAEFDDDDRVMPFGDPDKFLIHPAWHEFPTERQEAAQWHHALSSSILNRLTWDFEEAEIWYCDYYAGRSP
jgi:hypothetical protein